MTKLDPLPILPADPAFTRREANAIWRSVRAHSDRVDAAVAFRREMGRTIPHARPMLWAIADALEAKQARFDRAAAKREG